MAPVDVAVGRFSMLDFCCDRYCRVVSLGIFRSQPSAHVATISSSSLACGGLLRSSANCRTQSFLHRLSPRPLGLRVPVHVVVPHVERSRRSRQSRLLRRLRNSPPSTQLALSCQRFVDLRAFVFSFFEPFLLFFFGVSLGSVSVLSKFRECHLSTGPCVSSPSTMFWYLNGLLKTCAALQRNACT